MTQPLEAHELLASVKAVERFGSVVEAAKHLGIHPGTLRRRLAKADTMAAEPSERGFSDAEDENGNREISLVGDARQIGPGSLDDVLEMFGVDLAVWEVKDYKINAWGSASNEGDAVLRQVKVNLRRRVTKAVESAAKMLADRIEPIPVLPMAHKRRTGRLAVGGPYDTHIGMLVSPTMVPGSKYDLESAEQAYVTTIDAVVARMEVERPSQIIVPIANDFMHFENARAETTSGNHAVDYAARYADMVLLGHRLLEYTARRFLGLGCEVEALHVPDNHGQWTGWHMAHWLAARLSNEDRAKVCTGPQKFKFREYGRCLLGFTHGHKIKKERLYEVMTEAARGMWTDKVCCEWHTGHLHNEDAGPPRNRSVASMMVRQHAAMAPTNEYEYELGYIHARPRIQMHLYDDRDGHVGEATEYVA